VEADTDPVGPFEGYSAEDKARIREAYDLVSEEALEDEDVTLEFAMHSIDEDYGIPEDGQPSAYLDGVMLPQVALSTVPLFEPIVGCRLI